jgi:hypothetical protein
MPFESIYNRTGACRRFFVKGFWQETAVLHGAQMSVEMKPLPNKLIDALMAGYQTLEDLMGQNGLLKQLTKALVERALQAKRTDNLGHDKNQLVANEAGNIRNGCSKKTLKGDFGSLPIEIPCKRSETVRAANHQQSTRPARCGFDGKIPSLDDCGLTVRSQRLGNLAGWRRRVARPDNTFGPRTVTTTATAAPSRTWRPSCRVTARCLQGDAHFIDTGGREQSGGYLTFFDLQTRGHARGPTNEIRMSPARRDRQASTAGPPCPLDSATLQQG